jgi:hypothetical protein
VAEVHGGIRDLAVADGENADVAVVVVVVVVAVAVVVDVAVETGAEGYEGHCTSL